MAFSPWTRATLTMLFKVPWAFVAEYSGFRAFWRTYITDHNVLERKAQSQLEYIYKREDRAKAKKKEEDAEKKKAETEEARRLTRGHGTGIANGHGTGTGILPRWGHERTEISSGKALVRAFLNGESAEKLGEGIV